MKKLWFFIYVMKAQKLALHQFMYYYLHFNVLHSDIFTLETIAFYFVFQKIILINLINIFDIVDNWWQHFLITFYSWFTLIMIYYIFFLSEEDEYFATVEYSFQFQIIQWLRFICYLKKFIVCLNGFFLDN